MSRDFWWGMLCLPVVVVLAASVYMAVISAIAWSAHWGADTYKLVPKLVRERPLIVATVATAKWVRYCWIPGWHIVVCRTTLATKDSSPIQEQHRLMVRAIRGVFEQEQRRGIIDEGDF